MNPEVDEYLVKGCGRCNLYNTPECKVNTWREIISKLRMIILDTELKEEVKWNVPCYTYKSKNVLILSAFKDFASVNFFKGSLLKDPHNVLVSPGKNSQAGRYFKFTNKDQIQEFEPVLIEYIKEAIELEKAGKEVTYKDASEYDVPQELLDKFEADPKFKEAFDALTPGRQKGYYIHFSGAKQSSTRAARIDRCEDKIYAGKGFNER